MVMAVACLPVRIIRLILERMTQTTDDVLGVKKSKTYVTYFTFHPSKALVFEECGIHLFNKHFVMDFYCPTQEGLLM